MTAALTPQPWHRVQVRGAAEVATGADGALRPERLPDRLRWQVSDPFLAQTARESAGVRVAFRSDATAIELRVRAMRMVPDTTGPMPLSAYELTADGRAVALVGAAAGSRYVFSFEHPEPEIVLGPETVVRFEGLPGTGREYELWLPYTDRVELVSLSADRPVEPPAATGLRWLHHGSSISHGYRADTILGTWPVVAAREAGVALTNLSFSGNAVLDPFTARALRDTPADLISLKIGINIVCGDLMRLRVFRAAAHGFLDTIREGHPDTPIVVISPIHCPPVERSAGPTIQDPDRTEEWSIASGTPDDVAAGKLSLVTVRQALTDIVMTRREWGDDRIRYLDGLELYGQDDASRMPLPDNLHPGPDTQRLIGERFARRILSPAVQAVAGSGERPRG